MLKSSICSGFSIKGAPSRALWERLIKGSFQPVFDPTDDGGQLVLLVPARLRQPWLEQQSRDRSKNHRKDLEVHGQGEQEFLKYKLLGENIEDWKKQIK